MVLTAGMNSPAIGHGTRSLGEKETQEAKTEDVMPDASYVPGTKEEKLLVRKIDRKQAIDIPSFDNGPLGLSLLCNGCSEEPPGINGPSLHPRLCRGGIRPRCSVPDVVVVHKGGTRAKIRHILVRCHCLGCIWRPSSRSYYKWHGWRGLPRGMALAFHH